MDGRLREFLIDYSERWPSIPLPELVKAPGCPKRVTLVAWIRRGRLKQAHKRAGTWFLPVDELLDDGLELRR